MDRMYIITGAGGHLGGALIRELASRGARMRALALPGERVPLLDEGDVTRGDICDTAVLEALFNGLEGQDTAVIHAAGVVDISGRSDARMKQVNVEGTRNVIALCRRYGARLVYVSSVHAIAEAQPGEVIREADYFDPDKVEGGYAKTKAEATQLVLDAARSGLDALAVHPSGILGPYAARGNHLVQLLSDDLAGRLPACVRGGYDLVDVRDVAFGCVQAADLGASGRCYILSGRRVEIASLLRMARAGGPPRRLIVLPMGVAAAVAPLFELSARLRGRRALFTRYSLYALASNSNFSSERARRELGFRTRPLEETVRDTVAQLEPAAGRRALTRRRARLKYARQPDAR